MFNKYTKLKSQDVYVIITLILLLYVNRVFWLEICDKYLMFNTSVR